MNNFLDKLQEDYEVQLKRYQLEDQKLMFYYLTGRTSSKYKNEVGGISAKIIPQNEIEIESVNSSILVKNEYLKFLQLINKYSNTLFFLAKDVIEGNHSFRLKHFDEFSVDEKTSIYITENATWLEFKNWFKSRVEQIYFKNENQFSKTFIENYMKFLDKYFKKFGPKEEVDFKTAKLKSHQNFSVVRTLQNYQKFLYFRNLTGIRSYNYYWIRGNSSKEKSKLNKFDVVFGLRGKSLEDSKNSGKDLIIYYNGDCYNFGYSPEWGLNKNYSNFLKSYSLSDLMAYEGVAELIAFSKK